MSEIAEQIRALRSENAQIKAENRRMQAAISNMQGSSARAKAKTRMATQSEPVPYRLPPPGPAFAAGETPMMVTADKRLRFGTLTITPGGFLAAESVFRSRTEQADISSNYQAIPFQGQAATNEYRVSARQSRIALLAEAAITPNYLASAYAEIDFLGVGISSNANESNSYAPRIRHLYATLDAEDYGMHFLAGQTWSLVTMNSKGITPRNEVTPPTIDAQYVPGFDWKRQAQFRLTKDFDKRLWLSVSAEEAQTTFGTPGCTAGVNGGTAVGTIGGVNGITCALAGTGNLNPSQNYSLDHVPDVVAKVAYEGSFAKHDFHIEGYGLYRDLYDRVSYLGGNSTDLHSTGYGVGGGLIVPLLPKRLEFQVSGLIGRGIGSYGTGQMPDATFSSNGSLKPLSEGMALAGLTLHATPAIDLYAFGGFEKIDRSYFANGAAIANGSTGNTQYVSSGTGYTGYGTPNANDNGCSFASASTANNLTISANSCSGNSKAIYQGTVGMWDKLYKGSFGEVRAGLQYSYTRRELFQTTFNNVTSAPAANEQTVLTSFRYYPFQ